MKLLTDQRTAPDKINVKRLTDLVRRTLGSKLGPLFVPDSPTSIDVVLSIKPQAKP